MYVGERSAPLHLFYLGNSYPLIFIIMESKNKTMPSVYFSHEKPRKHQDEMLRDVTQAIHEGKHLIAHAPTGIGKTAAALGPALTYSLRENKTVFFLTPKISQHQIAVQELRTLAKKYNLDFLAVDMVGRRYSCVDPVLGDADFDDFYEICKKRRKEERCPFYANARGFDSQQKARAKIHMERILSLYETIVEHDVLFDMCASFVSKGTPTPLCTYEVAMQIAKKSSVIICDYFHLLSPSIRDTSPGEPMFQTLQLLNENHE